MGKKKYDVDIVMDRLKKREGYNKLSPTQRGRLVGNIMVNEAKVAGDRMTRLKNYYKKKPEPQGWQHKVPVRGSKKKLSNKNKKLLKILLGK